MGADLDRTAGVEFHEGILIPGMVNAHCHLELSHLRSKIAPGGGFTGFARAMGALPRDTPDRMQAISAQDAAMWHEGISAVGDVCNGEASFAAKSRSGIDYFSFLELFGLGTPSSEHIERLAATARAAGLRFGVTPHSSYSLQRALFSRAVELTPGQPLSVHFMESPEEAELFAGRGDMHGWYLQKGLRFDAADYLSPAGRIIAQVPPERKILLIHNTFAGAQEIAALEGHFGDRATWVLCPRSNRHITGALPPVGSLRRAGVRIALGTDSLASNDSLSLLEEMKALAGAAPLAEMLRWATANGARALNMEHLGSIEVGKTPGLAVIRGVDYDTMSLTAASTVRRII